MPGRWTRGRMAAVATGGATGAAVRWFALAGLEAGGDFPWPVLALNLAGSFALGVVLAEEWAHPRAHVALHDFAGIGFCGGLTTFSTFAVETAALLDEGAAGTGLAYAATSLLGAPVAVLAGAAAFRRVRAVALPLEEAP